MKEEDRPNSTTLVQGRRLRRLISVTLLLVVTLSTVGAVAYVGASVDLQQIQTVTTTTTITTVLMTTSTSWSSVTATVFGVLTTVQYTTSTSTVTYTGSDPNTMLLLHMDGADGLQTFVDSSVLARSVMARGNAQIDTASSKFGSASGLFDGSGDYVSVADSADWAFGSGDFTVDFWVRRGTTGTRQLICGQLASNAADGSVAVIVEFTANNYVQVMWYNTAFRALVSTTTMSDTATWHHIAVVGSSGTIKIYIDGVAQGNTAAQGTIIDSSSSYGVGRAGDYSGLYFNGWIDEFRVSKGIARWTSNFTPPTAPY